MSIHGREVGNRNSESSRRKCHFHFQTFLEEFSYTIVWWCKFCHLMESRAGREKQYLNILLCQTIYHFNGHLSYIWWQYFCSIFLLLKNCEKNIFLKLYNIQFTLNVVLWPWGNKCIQTTTTAAGWKETWSTIIWILNIHCNNHMIGLLGKKCI